MADVSKLCMGCMRQKPENGPCPACGYNNEPETNPAFLPNGATVGNGRYLLGKAIENNGEGITYIALDQENDITVTVREYYPLGLAERQDDGSVKIIPGNEFSFNEGCLLFLELSKKLLELKDLPILYPVLDIFEEQGTAYRVSADVPAIKLREFLMRNGGTLRWEQAKPLFVPLIASLKSLHDVGIIHRGISPDTLMVGRDGRIRLTGFCIAPARTVPSYLTAQLFPGFAAIEQYGSMGTQGDWTDIYGFGATLYRTLVGNPPPEATDRLNKDGLMIPSKIAQGIPTNVLKMMSGALQILPEERSQSMDEIREDLSQVDGKHPAARPTPSAGKKGKKGKKKNSNKKYALWAALATALLLVVLVVVLYFTVLKGDGGSDVSSQEPSSMPSLPISSVESTVTSNEPTVKLYTLPNFKGKTYAELISAVDYKGFYEFELVSKAYVGNYKAGQVYEQSPAAGDAVPKGTKVQLFVSLGPEEISVPNVIGLTLDEAKLKLYEAGFPPSSISEPLEKYDASATPGVVIEVNPTVGSKVKVEGGVTIYINSYQGDVPNVGF